MTQAPGSKPLAGRVALITGVSRRQGIGASLARRLLDDGASVLASGWEPHDEEMTWGADPGGIAAVLEELGGEGPDLAYQAADLERPEAAAELIDATIERFGSIDLVIANPARSSTQGFAEVSVEELDRCWAVNARSSRSAGTSWVSFGTIVSFVRCRDTAVDLRPLRRTYRLVAGGADVVSSSGKSGRPARAVLKP